MLWSPVLGLLLLAAPSAARAQVVTPPGTETWLPSPPPRPRTVPHPDELIRIGHRQVRSGAVVLSLSTGLGSTVVALSSLGLARCSGSSITAYCDMWMVMGVAVGAVLLAGGSMLGGMLIHRGRSTLGLAHDRPTSLRLRFGPVSASLALSF